EQKVSKPSFDTWLRDTKAAQLEDDQFIVSVQNDFIKDWLEGHYTKLTNELLQELTGSELKVKFIIQNHDNEPAETTKAQTNDTNQKEHHTQKKTMLNPKYTFDTFVIGAGNRFAHAASLAVRSEERRVGKECVT